jgi:hypothetical protein
MCTQWLLPQLIATAAVIESHMQFMIPFLTSYPTAAAAAAAAAAVTGTPPAGAPGHHRCLVHQGQQDCGEPAQNAGRLLKSEAGWEADRATSAGLRVDLSKSEAKVIKLSETADTTASKNDASGDADDAVSMSNKIRHSSDSSSPGRQQSRFDFSQLCVMQQYVSVS